MLLIYTILTGLGLCLMGAILVFPKLYSKFLTPKVYCRKCADELANQMKFQVSASYNRGGYEVRQV